MWSTTHLVDEADEQIPFSVTTIERDHIQRASTLLSLDEPLLSVPGVFVLNPFNFAQDSRISIRGFGAQANFGIRGIQLIVDGIPATGADGQGSVDAIDLGSAERIQVIRGPSSGIYGAASGGVILIETETGHESPFVEPALTAGSYGFLQLQLKAGLSTDPHASILNGTYYELEGYREHSRTEQQRIHAKLDSQLGSDTDLSTVFTWVDIPVQDDPGSLTLEQAKEDPEQARDRNLLFDSGEEVQEATLGLQATHQVSLTQELEFSAFLRQRDFENRLPFRNGGQVRFDRLFYGGTLRTQVQLQQVNLSLGLAANRQEDDRQNYQNEAGERGDLSLDQVEQVESVAGFAVLDMELHPQLTLMAALRQDWISYEVDDRFTEDGDDSGKRDLSELSPLAGILWEVRPETILYGNLSRSFETPTTTELANPSGGGFNPELDPQLATGMELGFKAEAPWWKEQRASLKMALFHIDLENTIVPFEVPSDPGRDFFQNAGGSERNGVEMAADLELAPQLKLALSYTWSDFRYQDDANGRSGNQEPGIPQHLGNLQLNYQGNEGVFARWNTRYTGSLQADDQNTEKVPYSIVSDLRLGWTTQIGRYQLEPYLGVNNLFNQSYFANIRINAFGGRYYEPAPERNFFAGLRLRASF